jgi:hypothetical protein
LPIGVVTRRGVEKAGAGDVAVREL